MAMARRRPPARRWAPYGVSRRTSGSLRRRVAPTRISTAVCSLGSSA